MRVLSRQHGERDEIAYVTAAAAAAAVIGGVCNERKNEWLWEKLTRLMDDEAAMIKRT